MVKNIERVHVSLYGSPSIGNLAFKQYYDTLLPATLQFGTSDFGSAFCITRFVRRHYHYLFFVRVAGIWNDPIIMYPPQPCNIVYWHCVGKDVILLPALQYLVEPSQLERYFIQLGHISSRAHRRFAYYHVSTAATKPAARLHVLFTTF